MKTFLLAWLLLCTTLFATPTDAPEADNSANTQNIANSSEAEAQEVAKVIYLSYEKIPSRVLKGEVFEVTIKTISTVKNFIDIKYELSNSKGLKLLNNSPTRSVESKYYYETFYFIATSENATLPDFTATLIDKNNTRYATTTLAGDKLNVISLNPGKDFSNIVASSFEIVEHKTTSYDAARNIVVFVATATNCDISALKLHNVYKQGTESITESHLDSKIIYYAIIDKKVENLSFSYFNITKNKFITIDLPIVVNDDSVTTQSDLKPKDQSNEILKMSIAAIVAFLALVMLLWKKNYIYLIFVIVPLSYVLYVGVPSKEVCIKEGAKIYLLPVANGTIFETTKSKYNLQKEEEVKGWIKVQLENKKIGWVKNEDICSH
ncbi:MAG: hypothetical protein PHQ93_01190 [Sulfurimonas sp.]|uniref:hypothetical protein n=1 Tax=Sulfurimonas sp. TaxID=2022749 RepID=UPI002638C35F|nr:hypothetical protein [Sulfurimonas sp.]MDD5399787.1 hypothetical protein [Sulfurimonas sp.]